MPRRLCYFREGDADLQGTALHLFLRAVQSCLRAQPRFDGLPSAGLDSHLFSASSVECWQVNQFYGTEWQIESDNVLQIDLPNATIMCATSF